MADVNTIFISALIVIALGYFLKRKNVITEKDGRVLSKIILNLTLPALIIKTISEIRISWEIALIPFMIIGFGLISLLMAGFLFRKLEGSQQGDFMMATQGFNIGLFAYPFIEGVWGQDGMQYIAMLDLGNAPLIFGIAYVIACMYSPKNPEKPGKKEMAKRLLVHVPLLSFIVALFLSLFQIELPEMVLIVLGTIANANKFLVFLVLGIYFNLPKEKTQWINIGKVLGLRYGFGILFGFLLFFVLPFNAVYRGVLLVGFVLPIGMAIIPYAVEQGLNEKLAGTLVNLSNLISFVLMWGIMLLIT
jgi:predicted permease